MEKEVRTKFLDNLKRNGKPYSEMEVYYKNAPHKLPVFEIDLNYLIYNRYNGRISGHGGGFTPQ